MIAKLRILALLLAAVFTVLSLKPVPVHASAGDDFSPCHEIDCPGGPYFCDYLDDGRVCNIGAASKN